MRGAGLLAWVDNGRVGEAAPQPARRVVDADRSTRVITVMPIAVYIADHRSCLERLGRHQVRLPGGPGFRLARKVMSCLSMKKS